MTAPRTTPLLDDPARAWTPYEPDQDRPWDLARVAHLHRRAGFAAPRSTLDRDLADGPGPSVDRLLDGEPAAADGTKAAEFDALHDAIAARLGPGASPQRLQGIWLYRMVFTPHPLRERMTLFWHGHFATSITKVENAALMQRQNALLRRHALGDFKALLAEIGRDPAMLVWLDSTANRKARPNENYAREVMELFTLGRGHYTEADIREAARAFTGWFVIRDRFEEVKAQHDDGPKTVLGRSGRFGGDDIPPILLEQPACAEFLARKLFRQFVSEVDEPSPALLAPLAESLRGSNYDVRTAVGMILRSNLFFDPAMRRRRVKSPVEHAIGMIRALEVLRPTVGADTLAESCATMGQSLYAPPSVAGWEGGAAWINTTTLLARSNAALGLVGPGGRCDPKALAARHGATDPTSVARFFVDLLVQDAFGADQLGRVEAAAAGTDGPRAAATLVLTAPEFQLA